MASTLDYATAVEAFFGKHKWEFETLENEYWLRFVGDRHTMIASFRHADWALSCHAATEGYVAEPDWPKAVAACNAWNAKAAIKAYLDVAADGPSDIKTEWIVPLPADQEDLDRALGEFLDSSHDFFEWANDKHAL